MKTKTIEQLAGKPEGSFKKFLKEKDAFLQSIETERKTRGIRRTAGRGERAESPGRTVG